MKKVLSLLLCVIMLCSLYVPAFADEVNQHDLDDLYNSYTIDFTDEAATANSEPAVYAQSTYAAGSDSILEAEEFVRSLDWSDPDTLYIREACLAELAEYRASGVELDSYTVLIPKSSATQYFLGQINGRSFYYTLFSAGNIRIGSNSPTSQGSGAYSLTNLTASQWASFLTGGLSLALSISSCPVSSLVFSSISTAVSLMGGPSNYEVYREGFVNTVCQAAVTSRTIYTYDEDGKKVNVRGDQKGLCEAFIYYCPVGLGFSSAYYELEKTDRFYVYTANYNNTQVLLQQCLAYYNRGASLSLTLSPNSIVYSVSN